MHPFFKDIWNQFFIYIFALSTSYMVVKPEEYVNIFNKNSPLAKSQSQAQASAPSQIVQSPATISNQVQPLPTPAIPDSTTTSADVNANQNNVPTTAPVDPTAALRAPAATATSTVPAVTAPAPPVANPIAPTAQAQGLIRQLKSKKIGEWVVDPNNGPDCDTDKINEAIINAVDGDIIKLKPGTYADELKIRKNVSIVGDNRENVVLKIATSNMFFIDKTNIQLQNLTLQASGLDPLLNIMNAVNANVMFTNVNIEGVAMSFQKSTIKFINVEIRNTSDFAISILKSTGTISNLKIIKSDSGAIRITEGSNITIDGLEVSEIKGNGIEISKSNVTLNSTMLKEIEGVAFNIFKLADVNLNLISCNNATVCLSATDNSKVKIKDVIFSGFKKNGLYLNDSEVNITGGRIMGGATGLYCENSKVTIDRIMFMRTENGIFCNDEKYKSRATDINASYISITDTDKAWTMPKSKYRITGYNNNPPF